VTTSLPFPLGETTWPSWERSADVAALVEKRLAAGLTIRQRNPALAEQVLAEVTGGLRIPIPGTLVGTPHSALGGIPATIGDRFVGREAELWRLHYSLTSRPAASGGAAGFGKTRVAVEYLHRFGPLHYRGGILWLNAEAGVEALASGSQIGIIPVARDQTNTRPVPSRRGVPMRGFGTSASRRFHVSTHR
jgi:hypothetical protein